jgi:hypothetical protein
MLGWNRNPLGGLLLFDGSFRGSFRVFGLKGFFQISTASFEIVLRP